jgi:predicted alpha/beta-fold hydrolase
MHNFVVLSNMGLPFFNPISSIMSSPEMRKKLVLLGLLGAASVASWSTVPHHHRSNAHMAFRSLYWSLLRSRGLRNIIITAIILSIISRHVFKGLTRKISFPTSLMIVWYLYYKVLVVTPCKLRCQRTFFNIQVIEKARLATTKFLPTPWGFNRHSQTILLYIISQLEQLWVNPIRFHKELVVCPGPTSPQAIFWVVPPSDASRYSSVDPIRGGDEMFVDARSNMTGTNSPNDPESSSDDNASGTNSNFVQVDSEYMNEPILILIHGLGNDRDHIPVQRYCRAASDAGWKVVVWEHATQSVTDTTGLHAVINHIAARYPASPLCAIAWSLGGLYLLKYLTEVGKDTPLVCAVSVSGCLSLLETGECTRDNENRAYWNILAAATKIQLRRYLNHVHHLSDQTRAKLSKHLDTESDPLRLYDYFQFYAGNNAQRYDTPYTYLSNVTRPHYESLVKDFHKVGVTTLLIHADDDPMVSNNIYNVTELARTSKYVISLNAKRGGHIAFYEGLLPFGKTWDLKISMQFISAVIESLAQINHILTVIKRVDSHLSSKMSRANLLSSESARQNQLPGALARIVSSASIFAKTPGSRTPVEGEEVPSVRRGNAELLRRRAF